MGRGQPSDEDGQSRLSCHPCSALPERAQAILETMESHRFESGEYMFTKRRPEAVDAPQRRVEVRRRRR